MKRTILLAAMLAACGKGVSDDSRGPVDASIDRGDLSLLSDGGSVSSEIQPQNAVLDVTVGVPVSLVYSGAASFTAERGDIGSFTGYTFVPTGAVGGITKIVGKGGAATNLTVRVHQVDGPNLIGGVWDDGAELLYPYDNTVWPRGIEAPIVQWKDGNAGDYDGVQIQAAGDYFEYRGTVTEGGIVRHQLPASAWNGLAQSNHGEDVKVSVYFTKGPIVYGPVQETWKFASGGLRGVIYYGSYGTRLAKNYCCDYAGDRFGAAILGIKNGSGSPYLVAGNDVECRGCHSLSADGSKLLANRDPQSATSYYDLVAHTETGLYPENGQFTWGALNPNGSKIYGQEGTTYAAPSGAVLVQTFVSVFTPAYSPDGLHLAYSDGTHLVVDGFFRDTPAGVPAWPSFTPDSKYVVYEVELTNDGRGGFGETRASCDMENGCGNFGATGELWIVGVGAGTGTAPIRLGNANGTGILPIGPNGHEIDEELNFQPTVGVVVSGGYAWVTFVSRRMYGNIGTANGYYSDPRYHDLRGQFVAKKLWVSAIDLSVVPGLDPSHPAFLLPGQEDEAGSNRGFWVASPCLGDGLACSGGDECCNGYCRGSVCANSIPSCGLEYDKCVSDADCCVGRCVNNRCATEIPK